MSFERNVFINCPFDADYRPILRPILFCIIALGLRPRIALERFDSAEPRLTKIIELIRESRFAIHDLSRAQASQAGEFYRLNMPFELGLDVGCRQFGGAPLGAKRCLILEAEPYRYQAALSDIAGSDIAVHRNDPVQAMSEVREWLCEAAGMDDAPGAEAIWFDFVEFTLRDSDRLQARGYSAANVEARSVSALMRAMGDWVRNHE